MQSGEGDRAVNMSHAGFPLSHYSVIEISLEAREAEVPKQSSKSFTYKLIHY